MRRPAFAKYLAGQTLSGFGTWIQYIAQALLLLDLVGTGRALGINTFLQFIPVMLLTPYAGVFVDRVEARWVLVATNTLSALAALVLWAVAVFGSISAGWLYAVSPILGLALTFDRPAQAALLAELLGDEDRRSANALASVVNASGRLVGPAVGGLLYAWRGASLCFLVNVVSYACVAIPLARVPGRQIARRRNHIRRSAWHELRAGAAYVWNSPTLRAPMIWTFVVGTLGFNFFTVIPALLRQEFGLGGVKFGLVEMINSAASVITGLWIARHAHRSSRRYLSFTFAFLAVAFAGNSLMPTYVSFLCWMPVFGAAFMFWLTSVTGLVQSETEPALLGRVMSIFSLALFGTTPIGAVITGWMIDNWSARHAMALGAVAALPAALWLRLVAPHSNHPPAPKPI